MNLEFTKGEYSGNRIGLIREVIQRKKPFVVYTFTNPKVYRQVIMDLSRFNQLAYVRQTFIGKPGVTASPIVYPSIFVTNYNTEVSLEDFKKMALGSMKHYGLDSVICLVDGYVNSYYKNGDHHLIGSDIYVSLDPTRFESYYFQVESSFYTFI